MPKQISKYLEGQTFIYRYKSADSYNLGFGPKIEDIIRVM